MSEENTQPQADLLRRIAANEDEIRFLRDDLADSNQATSSMEATLHIFSAQLKTFTDRRDPWHNIIAAAAVVLTIGALSLAPVTWLSIRNHQQLDRVERILMKRGELIGEFEATLEQLEGRIDHNEERFSGWVRRIDDRLYEHQRHGQQEE